MKHNTGNRTADKLAFRAAIFALCALSLVACGDDDVGAPIIMIDAGRDMNTPVDMNVARDMNPARVCGEAPTALPDTAVPRCANSTFTCLMGCTTAACQNACLDADPIPPTMVGTQSVDCLGCLNAEILSCAAAGACDDQWNGLTCCAVDNCGGMLTATCAMGACATAVDALQTCANSASTCQSAAIERCGGAVVDTDGGVPADGGDSDGGTPASDGGAAPDASAETDAGTDGGTETDAGTPTPTP